MEGNKRHVNISQPAGIFLVIVIKRWPKFMDNRMGSAHKASSSTT